MAKVQYKNGVTSVVLRVTLADSASTTGGYKTGLTGASAGLVIATIADVEATTTAYTSAGSTIDTIATLGTFAAPAANHCRFKEVDAANHPGLYEVQVADARWAVAGARSVVVTVQATGAVARHAEVQLTATDVNDAAAGGMTRLDAAVTTRSAPATAQTIDQTTALPGSPGAGTVGAALKNANTSLPNSAPNAAGGVPTIGSGNGQFNIAGVNVTPTTPTTGGGGGGGGGVNL